MEKPYRIEHEKDLADTRYRWQYRAGMTVKHMCSAKLKKTVRQSVLTQRLLSYLHAATAALRLT